MSRAAQLLKWWVPYSIGSKVALGALALGVGVGAACAVGIGGVVLCKKVLA